jgi:predicted Fe-Mo cluster-binding NifX family protein
MNVALPTDDRTTLAEHFGRAAAFAVFAVEGKGVRFVGFRPNTHEHAEREGEACADGAGHTHDFGGPLGDVRVVICRGFGRRAQEALGALGIDVIFTAGGDLNELASRYARGELTSGAAACGCGHDQ